MPVLYGVVIVHDPQSLWGLAQSSLMPFVAETCTTMTIHCSEAAKYTVIQCCHCV